MEFEPWLMWAIISLVFIIVEIFTAGFAVICFSIGAAAAAVCAFLDFQLVWQLFAFAVFSAISLIFVRPLVLKFFHKKEKEVKTNADAIIGRKGRVSERIDSTSGTGRVAIDGDDWKAVSSDGQPLETGESVVIESRDGLTLTVSKLS